MMFMNEFEIENAVTETRHLPNLHTAASELERLMDWANRNSDGWHSWPKPARAAAKLMALIEGAKLYTGRAEDCTEADVKKALIPVKVFLTRHGVPHGTVIEG